PNRDAVLIASISARRWRVYPSAASGGPISRRSAPSSARSRRRRLGKEEILSRYLNTAYFGAGVYGVGAPANGYFGKTAKELSLREAAMLAGLVRAPSALARQRAALVCSAPWSKPARSLVSRRMPRGGIPPPCGCRRRTRREQTISWMCSAAT